MVKKPEKKIKEQFSYTAVFEPDPSGGFVVSVPALPGCVTQGETFEEAYAMIKDAVSGYLSILSQERLEVPQEIGEVVVTQIKVPSLSAL